MRTSRSTVRRQVAPGASRSNLENGRRLTEQNAVPGSRRRSPPTATTRAESLRRMHASAEAWSLTPRREPIRGRLPLRQLRLTRRPSWESGEKRPQVDDADWDDLAKRLRTAKSADVPMAAKSDDAEMRGALMSLGDPCGRHGSVQPRPLHAQDRRLRPSRRNGVGLEDRLELE